MNDMYEKVIPLSKPIKLDAHRAMNGAWGRGILLLLISLLPGALLNVSEWMMRKLMDIPLFIDTDAKSALNFGAGVDIHLVSLLLSAVLSVLLMLVSLPLLQGIKRWFFRRTYSENESVRDAFFYFEAMSDYGKTLWLHLRIKVYTLLWGILFFSPAIAMLVYFRFYRYDPQFITPPVRLLLYVLTAAWMILAAILTSIRSSRYFLAPYLLAQKDSCKATVALRRSCRLMRGYAARVFMFRLSFIVYLIPAVIAAIFYYAFSIPTLWAAAGLLGILQMILILMAFGHYEMSCAIYARFVIEASQQNEYPNVAECSVSESVSSKIHTEDSVF